VPAETQSRRKTYPELTNSTLSHDREIEDCAPARPQSSEGDSNRTEGDSTIPQNPKPGSQESTRIPLGKGQGLTFTFTIGGATKPQLEVSNGGGSAGGNAGVSQKGENKCESLVDEHQSVGPTANFGSNVVVPDQGISSGHQTPFSSQQPSATPGNGVPLSGEVSETSIQLKLSHPCIEQHGDGRLPNLSRGTGPAPWAAIKMDIRCKPWERLDLADVAVAKLGESETSGRTSVAGETSLSAGISRIMDNATAGKTAGTLVCPRNEPRPSESLGAARPNLPRPSLEMAESAAESAKSVP
jgi:hypothetical protein